MVFDIGIRILIVLTTLLLIFYEQLDYKIPFLVLTLFYISSIFVLLSFSREKPLKFLIFLVDIIFISTFSYLTSYPEIALFIFPLAINFLENKKNIIQFSIFALIPVLVGIYISGFSEIAFITIYLAFIISFIGFYSKLNKEKQTIDKIKSNMENLYVQNLELQDEITKYKHLQDIYDLTIKLNERKISLQAYLTAVYELTNTKGIVFYDFLGKKCISIGNLECKKDIPKYLTTGFNVLQDTKVNKELLTKYIISFSVENKNNIHGFLLLGYESLDEEELNIIKTIFIGIKSYHC
ncbi:MAG: hypothetical protein GXO22_04070 [Aquificae bacterium]|nr:hypothetical protein [Aquificota bacterium]